jgi:hypothetical protein
MTNDESEKPNPPPPRPQFSAVCPDDFGLKAGFWSGKEGDPVEFRPIVGWVSITNWLQVSEGVSSLVPVVLNSTGYPMIDGRVLRGYIGVFGKASTPAEAREKYRGWEQKKTEDGGPPPGQSQPN